MGLPKFFLKLRPVIHHIILSFQSYYKAKKDKTAMELAAYNKIQKEKMQKIRSAKKTARQLAGMVTRYT
jgi:hypothetical protein